MVNILENVANHNFEERLNRADTSSKLVSTIYITTDSGTGNSKV
jgi:hypothetical protein